MKKSEVSEFRLPTVTLAQLNKRYEDYIITYRSSEIPKHLRIEEKKIRLENILKTSQGVSEVKKTNIVLKLGRVTTRGL